MGPKKGGKGKAKNAADEDDDWEKVLQEQIEANKALQAEEVTPPPVPAEAQGKADEEDEDDDEEDDGKGAKKDKKKKKKKKAEKKEEVKKSVGTTSAAGRAILLRQQQVAEEEARRKKAEEEEAERIRLEEERIEAERRAIEAEKERKKKAKQDKIDAQKAAGTYMTKAEKEKAKKAQARLEAMKAAGMLNVPGMTNKGDSEHSQPTRKVAAPKSSSAKTADTVPVKAIDESPSPAEESKDTEKLADDQEEEEEEDEWDNGGWELNLDKISAKVEVLKNKASEDVEDMIVLEKKKEQEKLKKIGIDRAKRDEELRIQREKEDEERAEMEAKEREAAIRKETSRKNRLARDEAAKAARSPDNLRSAISCIMGHVDTGKTKLLDKIRHTSVQEGEAGGITQQIGATQFTKETLALQTQSLQAKEPFEINLPGLLVIDTPGHEAFSNLRNRGSSLCDIAILVIDLVHGLEPQTIESMNMLRKKKCPFVVALNKVDRLYGWKTMPDSPIRDALAAQNENCRIEFKDRAERTILQLMEQGLNAKLYWENDDLQHTVSLVPTSAISGEGIPDLLKMVITLTQSHLTERLMYCESLQCTVLEVKVIEGLGHTVDVVLVNGTLREGDTIVLSTLDGPVVTTVRALLTPPPSREMRIKSEYIHHESLKGAIGVKIVAPDIGRTVAGTPILVVQPGDDVDDVKEDVHSDISQIMKSLQVDNQGVMVHASTLGAMEALLQFLREECKPAIPVGHINIGPIHKIDVMRANLMNEKKKPEFATILAFDVSADTEAANMAEELNVRIFNADIIYHLFDQFTNYMKSLRDERKQLAASVVMFPCVLKILPQHVFNTKNPIVVGVEVIEGTLRLNTLISIPSLNLDIGRVTRIESNHKEITSAKKATSVAIRIVNEGNPTLMYGRQFDHTHTLYSKMSRASIDALKEYYADEMTKPDWALVIKLKKLFNIT